MLIPFLLRKCLCLKHKRGGFKRTYFSSPFKLYSFIFNSKIILQKVHLILYNKTEKISSKIKLFYLFYRKKWIFMQ